jgi:hypothetical protein
MKALVYHGPGQRTWAVVPDPAIQEPTDVVARIACSEPDKLSEPFLLLRVERLA